LKKKPIERKYCPIHGELWTRADICFLCHLKLHTPKSDKRKKE